MELLQIVNDQIKVKWTIILLTGANIMPKFKKPRRTSMMEAETMTFLLQKKKARDKLFPSVYRLN